MKINEYVTLNSIYQNKVLTDNEIISKLEKIGLTSKGNDYRIEKKLQLAVNNFDTLCFDDSDDFDRKIKENILLQGQHSKIKLNF